MRRWVFKAQIPTAIFGLRTLLGEEMYFFNRMALQLHTEAKGGPMEVGTRMREFLEIWGGLVELGAPPYFLEDPVVWASVFATAGGVN